MRGQIKRLFCPLLGPTCHLLPRLSSSLFPPDSSLLRPSRPPAAAPPRTLRWQSAPRRGHSTPVHATSGPRRRGPSTPIHALPPVRTAAGPRLAAGPRRLGPSTPVRALPSPRRRSASSPPWPRAAADSHPAGHFDHKEHGCAASFCARAALLVVAIWLVLTTTSVAAHMEVAKAAHGQVARSPAPCDGRRGRELLYGRRRSRSPPRPRSSLASTLALAEAEQQQKFGMEGRMKQMSVEDDDWWAQG